jgi:hypothetical protein
MGTPSYFAPEQAQGMTVGPAADIYALGAILYECLTGRPPFRAASAFETIRQVLNADPVPPRQLNANVPIDLETICLKCLRKEPENRYASAKALGDDLDHFLKGEPIEARPVGAMERGLKWVRRNPAVAALLALVFVALTAGITASTLFALDARDQAATARQKAEDAATQKGLADENASLASQKQREAEQSQQETARMADDLEKTLCEGLLRGIGRRPKTDPRHFPVLRDLGMLPDPQTLEPIETETLTELGAVRFDRTRLRLLEMALADAPTAERVGRQAGWVVHGVVGLSPQRRQKAVDLVVKRIGSTDNDELAMACALLGWELGVKDSRWADRAAGAIVKAMSPEAEKGVIYAPRDLNSLRERATMLEVVSERLDRKRASHHAAGAAKALLINLLASRHFSSPPDELMRLLDAVIRRLEPEDLAAVVALIADWKGDAALAWAAKTLAPHLGKEQAKSVAEGVLRNMSDRRIDPAFWDDSSDVAAASALSELGRVLPALNERLDAGQAASNAGKVADLLGKAIDRTLAKRRWHSLTNLAEALAAVIRHLPEKEATGRAEKVTAAVLGKLKKATDGKEITELTSALLHLTERLGPTERAEALYELAAVEPADWQYPPDFGARMESASKDLGPEDAKRIGDRLVKTLVKLVARDDKHKAARSALARWWKAVSARMDPKEAASQAAQVVEAFIPILGNKRAPAELEDSLAPSLALVYDRLSATDAARAARVLVAVPEEGFDDDVAESLVRIGRRLNEEEAARTFVALVRRMKTARGWPQGQWMRFKDDAERGRWVLPPLQAALEGLSGRLNASGAARASRALVAALETAESDHARGAIAELLQTVSGRMDADSAHMAAIALVDALKAERSYLWAKLAETLAAVTARLPQERAAKLATRAADALLAAIAVEKNLDALPSLAQALDIVSGRLPPEQVRARAATAAGLLVEAIPSAGQSDRLFTLARAIKALGGRPECGAAVGPAARAAVLLILARPFAGDDNLLMALKTLSPFMTPTLASEAARAIVAAMTGGQHDPHLAHLADAFRAISERLEAREAVAQGARVAAVLASPTVSGRVDADAAVKAAEAVVVALAASVAPGNVGESLKGICARLDTADLVRVLAHPLCAARARRAVLDVLGARCKRHFRNAWHFLDWAEANGVALAETR